MKLYVTALNSGSNGNCYYIANENEAVLVDVGISCREVEKRMKRLNLNIKKIKAVFVSHEHSDHIRGVNVFSKKYQLPVFLTAGTLENARLDPRNPLITLINPYVPIFVGNLEVIAFPKFHDANDPQSFVVKYNGLCIGVFTDIGAPCEHVIKHFKCCNAIFLEANYDDEMLIKGNYPPHLKYRISSQRGHLSNKQALDLFLQHRPKSMTHVFLSHISKENNNPGLVLDLFKLHCGEVEVILTSRYEEIPVFEIGVKSFKPYQGSFFDQISA